MRIIRAIPILFGVFLLAGCSDNITKCPDPELLTASFVPLPENRIAVDEAAGITARYIDPVTRYTHGILGDAIEAGGVLVTQCDRRLTFSLDTLHVFEDLQPRLFDIINNGIPELVTILTSVSLGASVAVFEIGNDSLYLKAQSEYIGRYNRWLNIAAINDLDNDGIVEIAWVSTPHIGGLLKIGQLDGVKIVVVDSISGVSNHRIHLRNLCLSVVSEQNNQKTLYLPNDDFNAVIGLRWMNKQIVAVDTIWMEVDPEVPLNEQYDFSETIGGYDCD